MKERAIVFGSHAGLVGVLTEPSPLPMQRRAVVLSNVGTHHRVGPYRLYVDLARHFAARGWYVLRFDLSGFGDSDPRPGTEKDTAHYMRDLTEAMDLLQERHGIEQFLLVGLCSGVDIANAVAIADRRVSGAVFIDGYTFPSARFRVRRSLRLLQVARLVRYARRRVIRWGDRDVTPVHPEATETVFTREYPSLDQFRAGVRTMADRGTRMLFVFTGSVDYRYNAESQLFEQLGPMPRTGIDVGYLRDADHLFSSVASRQKLLALLDRWTAPLETLAVTLDRALDIPRQVIRA